MEKEGLPQEGSDSVLGSNRNLHDAKRAPSMLDLRRDATSFRSQTRGFRGAESHRGGDRAVMRKLGEIMGALGDVKARIERLEAPGSSHGKRGSSMSLLPPGSDRSKKENNSTRSVDA